MHHSETSGTAPSTKPWWLLACLILGVALRLVQVPRPFDQRLANPWRQADTLQIARNFDREGMNLLYPRIDWRGDTPGYAEMELPILPWLGALSWRLTGVHVQVLRLWSAAFEIFAFLLFTALARRLLPPAGALAATAAYAANPLLLVLAGSLQPEPVMLAMSLAAVSCLERFRQGGRGGWLGLAAGALALAILAKLPALYLGLVFAWVVFERLGRRALVDWRVWAAATVSLLPAVAWYTWSHRFYTTFGNSLGVSNESHFLGLDMLWPPRFLLGILRREVIDVFTPAGVLLALAALFLARQSSIRLPLVWYAAASVFYLLAARTSADAWANYYHSLSVAPACLLVGAGFAALFGGGDIRGGRARRLAALLLLLCTLLLALTVAGREMRRNDTNPYLESLHACTLELGPRVPPEGEIVVRGGTMTDDLGHAVAHNESMVFAWMDRKGFTYGDQELSLATLDRLAAAGGRYWLVGAAELQRSGLVELAHEHYRLLAACERDRYWLFDLHDSSPADAAGAGSSRATQPLVRKLW